MDLRRDFPILDIDDQIHAENAEGRASRDIIRELDSMGFSVIEALSGSDGRLIFTSKSEISCVLLDWDLGEHNGGRLATSASLLDIFRARNAKIPVFVLTDKLSVKDIPLDIARQINGYIWKMEDTPQFIAGRIEQAVNDYLNHLLPPFFKELVRYVNEYKYAWHTPGHCGGEAFLKSAPGQVFFDFFGENTLRGDLSVSVPELGSLLDQTGVVEAAEKNAAKIFGADKTYFVTNGTSGANKIVFHGNVARGDLVLVDRNCHKSVMHGIVMTGAVPLYLTPTRNAYGIIGPIHVDQFSAKTIKEKIKSSSLIKSKEAKDIKMAVITNSTYDGLCYNTNKIKQKLGNGLVQKLHFDEAWFGYAKFHPLYRDRFGMSNDIDDKQLPSVFATQSTHKVLASFSQGSMIQIKNNQNNVDYKRFQEAYMMHTSTSPQYGIIASLDVGAEMMKGKAGNILINETIEEAVIFRKKMVDLGEELAKQENKSSKWWFNVWQPDEVTVDDPGPTGAIIDKDLETVQDDVLTRYPQCWTLKPGADWHGFEGMEDDYILLDPTKVTILMPGIDKAGRLAAEGIPAHIVSEFLMSRGIVVEKTGYYSFLVLFTIGITKGKSGTLLAELLEFKKLYDENALVEDVLPELSKKHPQTYGNRGLKDFCHDMHDYLKKEEIAGVVKDVYARLPEADMIPADAYDRMVKGEVEPVGLKDIKNRTAAVMIVPYPPGIPVIMPGEKFSSEAEDIIKYLIFCRDFDNRFPGFENEMQGIIKKVERGKVEYQLYCVK